jgi:lysophospholipase L1-like esterase/dienelactone hydrolase
MKNYIILILFFLFDINAFSQESLKWDDINTKDWPAECKRVFIPSSVDKAEQPAFFYKAKSENLRPLIVSLHTWSGGYEQLDSLSWQSIEKDYNYIHPHFRGPNNTFDACGSPLVISDIDDAIDYAMANTNVDPHNIHIVGVSGGGYATLLCYMKTRHNIKTFSAWVPLSNLVDWYYESEGRKNKYSRDIALATTGKDFEKDDYYMDENEAMERSPFFMKTPVEKRRNSKLFIYAGVHDGYTGSVPITQSVNFYNKLVKDFDSTENQAIVPAEDIITLLSFRGYPAENKSMISNREIHYRKEFQDKIQLTLFEGTHEQLLNVALNQVEGKNILTLGDSNGALKDGWVNQLKAMRFDDFFYNTSVPGNTIGFDNNGNESLNTLRQLDNYLSAGEEKLGYLDAIIIMLGTNDCKAVFADSLNLVPSNMTCLISKIKSSSLYEKSKPQIFIISPPPVGDDLLLGDKYKGSGERVEYLNSKFKKIANKEDVVFVDTYSSLADLVSIYSLDGIHYQKEGQTMIAEIIDAALKENFNIK